MSHIRPAKSLETPRPLKSSSRQTHSHTPLYEIQSIEDLISLLENVASKLQAGCNDQESMSILLSNLRILGPQLEIISKDTLDRTFVTFRNSSQNPQLNIMTRLNLLELIELRAKSWQNSDGINSYYKHKVTNVEPDTISVSTLNDNMTLLSTSPPSLSLIGQTTGPILGSGEILKTSGKFPRPTKIPGKNYSKDEVVIRNADSGKVMGIKGRRVHMIEELSETIISFQRVNPGAKERLVQITGPNEEKIVYAKQLIEETIRRNASPVRLEQTQQGGSCSSLASSASDETQPRNTNSRSSVGGSVSGIGNNSGILSTSSSTSGGVGLLNNYVPNITSSNIGGGGNIKLSRNGLTGGQNMLLHSFSTNDATLGEYKYTVNVGQHNIKITGECCELVRVAKLVLDDYFSSNEFAAALEAGTGFDTTSSTSSNQYIPSMIPQSHQLISSSPFVDSGISLDLLSKNSQIGLSNNNNNNNNSYDIDDDVFIVDNANQSNRNSLDGSTNSTSSSSNTVVTSTPLNGLTRSRRSHFLRKDSTPEATTKDTNKEQSTVRIVHEYERLLYYSKSPHSTALPQDNEKITQLHPNIVKNKVIDEKTRFDPDKHLNSLKSVELANITNTSESNTSSESPDPE